MNPATSVFVPLHSSYLFNLRVLIALIFSATGEISVHNLNAFSLKGIVMFKPLQLIFLENQQLNQNLFRYKV